MDKANYRKFSELKSTDTFYFNSLNKIEEQGGFTF